MDRKKYIKGFLLGVLCTVLIGGGVSGYLWYQNQKGIVNNSTVKKAKLIEGIIDEYYLEDIDKEELESYRIKDWWQDLVILIPDTIPRRNIQSSTRAQGANTWVWE